MEGALLSQIPLWATGAQVHVETAISPEGPGSRGIWHQLSSVLVTGCSWGC